MKRKFSVSALLFVSLPLAALAAPMGEQGKSQATDPGTEQGMPSHKANPAELFDQLDTSHKGYITREDAKRAPEVLARWDELDTKHDGKVTREVFIKSMSKQPL